MIVDTGEVKLFVQQSGEGEPLILIHGLGMSSALWINQIPVFSQRFHTVAVDLRGFGQSSHPDGPGDYAIDILAEDIAVLIERLDLGRCHILGTSMGGFIGQALALAHPNLCRSLLLCHTAPRMSIPSDVLERRVEALRNLPLEEYAELVVEQACSANASRELRTWVAGLLVRNDKCIYTQVMTEGLRDFDVGADLGGINIPTLVITGEHDLVLPKEGGEEIARLIPGARLVEITGVGHLGYAERPAVFNEAVLSFLNDVQKRGQI
ncbi:MAG: alpha/beta fold hydrolase [Gammaproteobacteria bacterium]|nr:alpha/beta fold hydrolase [Gammaproteobacteria bacterium]MDE0511112.1 alpha/beta fold hydrolase [Gammaproteobacteria bacterium]